MASDLKEVKALRDETGLGFMACKRAMEEASGDRAKALELLRKRGMATAEKRRDRTAEQGRIGLYISPDGIRAGLVEIRCETDFVARSDDFVRLTESLAEAVSGSESAVGSEEQALRGIDIDAPSFLVRPAGAGRDTVEEEIKGIGGRVGEKVAFQRAAQLPPVAGRRYRIGGYLHHDGRAGALVRLAFGKEETAGQVDGLLKDLSMHVVAYVPSPVAITKEDIPPETLEKEKAIQADTDEIKKKPEAIREKILTGKMQKFMKDNALLEQPLVTVTDGKMVVSKVLANKGEELSDTLAVAGFLRFQLGEG